MATIAIELDRDKLRAFCDQWKISEFALFGSVVRPEEFRPDSDVDVLVRFAPGASPTLFEFIHAQEELAGIVGRRVDLVQREAVEESTNRFRKRSILNSAVLLDVA